MLTERKYDMENKFEFDISTVDEVVNVELKGHLDANNAYPLMEEMKKLIGTKVKELRYKVAGLNYISSAGLRVIIFSKQKIGYDADVIMEQPQEAVLSVIEMSGLNNFVTIEK